MGRAWSANRHVNTLSVAACIYLWKEGVEYPVVVGKDVVAKVGVVLADLATLEALWTILIVMLLN